MAVVEIGAASAYALAGVWSLVLSLLLTPLALRAAVRLRWLDHPGGHKGHAAATPYLGGAAVVVAFSAAVLGGALLAGPPGGISELAAIIGTGVGLALVGLVDDLRGLGPLPRVASEVVAGLVIWRSGVGIDLAGHQWVDAMLTVVWIVGVVNAFNLLDNMDGLSAGVASIAALTFFVLAALDGQILVATLAIALAGCTAGFLKHNFAPARIYLGDSGSMFIGFVLGAIGIKLRFPTVGRDVAALVPLLTLGVALLDTGVVVISRLIHRRNPFDGGRDHVSHRLVFLGLPVHVAVGVIYAGAISTGWIAIIVSRSPRMPALMLAAFLIVVVVAFGVLLARVPVYETSKRRRVMLREVLPHELEPPTAAPYRGRPSSSGDLNEGLTG